MPSDGSNWAQALGTPQAARSYSTPTKKNQQHSNRPAGSWGLHISRGSHSHVHALVEKPPRPAQRPQHSGVVSTVFFLCFFDDHLLAF